jgi:glycosyltransferase involved in cell wall biosynthesis
MKVALVHDYLKEIGGAERVLLALKEMFPQAPVYTAYAFPKYWGEFRKEIEKWDIRQSWGKYLPFLPNWVTYYTPLSPLFFQAFDLSDYDVVIVSATGAYLPNGVKVGPKTLLVTYCHTPPRFLYGYPTANRLREKWYIKPVDLIINHILRMVDFKLAQHPKVFIANSQEVKRRIEKFYRRESEVVYPPVSPSSVPPLKLRGGKGGDINGGFYLMVTRIVGSKNIELAVACARKYGFKLKIAGREIGKKIDMTGAEYLGEVSDEQKAELLANARGFLCLEEAADFGVTAVEPQMYGTPVIAYRAGGYLESVVEGKTGVFFDELTVDSLWEAIQRAEKIKWDRKKIQNMAARFDENKFRAAIMTIIKRHEHKLL